MIYDILKAGRFAYAFPGNTLSELIDDLIEKYGEQVRDSLKDQRTQILDPAIQININNKYIIRDHFCYQKIQEGDKIIFLKLLAGG